VITSAPIDASLPIATGRVTDGSFEELYSGIDGAVGAAPGKYGVVLASGDESIEAAKSRYSGGGSNAAGGSASLPDYQTKVLPFAGKYSTSVTSDKEVEVMVGPNDLTIDVSSK
jgi:hypothetical protein